MTATEKAKIATMTASELQKYINEKVSLQRMELRSLRALQRARHAEEAIEHIGKDEV